MLLDDQVLAQLRERLGLAERKRLDAVLRGRRVCARHPGTGFGGGCSCGSSAGDMRACDATEQRQREADDKRTALSREQREALCGALGSMLAAGAAARVRGGSG